MDRGKTKTAFDRSVDAWMKDQKFAKAYEQARAGINSVDVFMQSLEATRIKAGISKAELSRLTNTNPVVMRRLLTTDAPNPTLGMVMGILKSMGYGLALVPMAAKAKKAPAKKTRTAVISA
jgi:DNA-binding phage protein